MRLYPDLVSRDIIVSAENAPLASITNSAIDPDKTVNEASAPLDRIAEIQAETLGLLQLGQELAKLKTTAEVAEAIAGKVRLLVPASLTAVYVVGEARQDVFVACAVGENEGLAAGVRFPWQSPYRLGGRESTVDSKFGCNAGSRWCSQIRDPRLRSCMAIPVVWEG